MEPFIGHAAARQLLDASLAHPASAYLLVGEAHLGKRLIAEWFVSRLVDEDASRLRMHPDVVWLEAEEGKTQVSAEIVRTLRERVSLSPARARQTVVVVPEANRLNETGMNALLKIIEEPPAGAVFVLVAEDATRIPATIKSRSVVLSFSRVAKQEIEAALIARGVPVEEAAERATIARGRPGLALEPELTMDVSHEITRVLDATSPGAALQAIEHLSKTCDSSDDAASAWRSAIQAGCDALRMRLAEGSSKELRWSVALLQAFRQAGSAVSPRLALEAAVMHDAWNTDAAAFFPSPLVGSVPVVYSQTISPNNL